MSRSFKKTDRRKATEKIAKEERYQRLYKGRKKSSDPFRVEIIISRQVKKNGARNRN